MRKLFQSRAGEIGLPPGTAVFLGGADAAPTRVRVVDYTKDDIEEKEPGKVEECFPFRDKASVTWIDIEGFKDLPFLEELGAYFGLHPLVVEDVVNTTQRPKIEEFEDHFFVVLKSMSFEDAEEEMRQVSLVVGKNFVLSFQEGNIDAFEAIRDRLRSAKGRIRSMGSDYLAYALMDALVDGYFVVLERCAEKIERLEEEVVWHPGPETLGQIHTLRKELILLRKSIWPLREVVNVIGRGERALIRRSTEPYLRDLYDHVVQLVDTLESFREMVTGLLETYLSSLGNRTNEVMKVLTIMATIFIPLTFIAGVYGMNFRHMPELEWHYGYGLALGAMAAVAVGMLLYFRKKKWI